jgi:hypothetical protein
MIHACKHALVYIAITAQFRWGHVSKGYIYIQLILQFEQQYHHRPTTLSDSKALAALTTAALSSNGMQADYITADDIHMLCTQVSLYQTTRCCKL